ncbi:MAG: SLBB domain-containing protein [Magnetococcales bacterium]|nr:SLBB domain-containing protein [Magnetococcales bacterium]
MSVELLLSRLSKFRSVTWFILPILLMLLAHPAYAFMKEVENNPALTEDRLLELLSGRNTPESQFLSPLDKLREAKKSQKMPGKSLKRQGEEEIQSDLSVLEADYSLRTGTPLTQFGYDVFNKEQTGGPLTGAIGEDYRIGIGEQMVLIFRGKESTDHQVKVDREGRMILPGMPPIQAAGRTFGEVRQEVKERTHKAMAGTDVFLSIGAVRSFSVMVVGEVAEPGGHRLTGLSTVMDALSLAGGIKKTGSLRTIRLQRQNHTRKIDLYDLLIDGRLPQDLTLQEGDVIMVPPIGPTVAAAWNVIRPGIFELSSNQRRISLSELLGWAGGSIRPSGNHHYLLSLDSGGNEKLIDKSRLTRSHAQPGDVLLTRWKEGKRLGFVSVQGNVKGSPVVRALAQTPTVADLVRSITFEKNPYLLFAVLETTDENTLKRQFQPLNLHGVLSGQIDHPLKDEDVLIVLGTEDVQFLTTDPVKNARGSPSCQVLSMKADEELVEITSEANLSFSQEEEVRFEPRDLDEDEQEESDRIRDFRSYDKEPSAAAAFSASQLETLVSAKGIDLMRCPDLLRANVGLLKFLLEFSLTLHGEIREPGVYPITPGTPLDLVITNAGGLTREADTTLVELSREVASQGGSSSTVVRNRLNLSDDFVSQETALLPKDTLLFNATYSDRERGIVNLSGAFIRPGGYEIRRGERLLELILRAGGLTDQAYPLGAVFSRKSVKKSEEEAFNKSALEVERAMASMATDTDENTDSSNLSILKALADSLRNTEPVGRVVVESDPTILQVRPEFDIIMEPGDKLYMPKRSNFVTVTGEVLNPGNLSFLSGANAEDYITRSGGLRKTAMKEAIFMISPNGAAQPLNPDTSWNARQPIVTVAPGSVIVVPLDPKPFDWMTTSINITELLSQLAVTAASLAVIGN